MSRLIAPSCLLASLLLVLAAPPADARRHHGRHHHRGAHTSTDRTQTPQRQTGERVGAASQEIDKVLDAKIKNICRGC